MLAHAGSSNGYWADAVATAAYLRNRATTSALQEDKTPYEMWYETSVIFGFLDVWHTLTFLTVKDENWTRRQRNFVLLVTARDTGSMTIVL